MANTQWESLRWAWCRPIRRCGSLLDDGDIWVRKFALKSVAHANIATLK